MAASQALGALAESRAPTVTRAERADKAPAEEGALSYMGKLSAEGGRAGAKPAAYREREIQRRGSGAGWQLAGGDPAWEAAGSVPHDAAAAVDGEGEMFVCSPVSEGAGDSSTSGRGRRVRSPRTLAQSYDEEAAVYHDLHRALSAVAMLGAVIVVSPPHVFLHTTQKKIGGA
jgi:hypothetical protein